MPHAKENTEQNEVGNDYFCSKSRYGWEDLVETLAQIWADDDIQVGRHQLSFGEELKHADGAKNEAA